MPGPWYFAWAGGAIEPQITLATNGTTHGASVQTSILIGYTIASLMQINRLSSSANLEPGALYRLEGPGVSAYAIFDDSVLSGEPGSLNLSNAATATNNPGQFTATKSATIGTVLGTTTQGSNAVTLDAPGLAAGVYGIAGTAIGETDVPVGITDGTTVTTGGGVTRVSSCYLDYAGGGIGSLYIYAATPHTTTGTGDFGEPTSTTIHTVGAQPVRATTGGQSPMVLSGFATNDPAIITGIPSGALMSLTPFLLYNITGNGIPVGATFVAPGSGTSLTLDLPATTSEINAILTITGPRTPNAPFDPALHNRFDEEVIGIEIAQEEGGLATLTLDIKNPGVGLLATGRNLWCWLSWDQAWAPGGSATPDLVPLFNGRLIGVPRLQASEIVQLQFLARPDDLNAQKAALAASLQVLPYYDPVWLSGNTNLDTVLESYSALWHIDRSTLLLTTSDVLEGEAGIVDIGEDRAIYNNFTLSYGQPPLVATSVTGTVTWQQQAGGRIDVTERILHAFHDAGSAYINPFATEAWRHSGGGLIQVLCGDGLQSDWPKPGASIGAGWAISPGVDTAGGPLSYIYEAKWMEPTTYDVTYESQFTGGSEQGDTLDQTRIAVYMSPIDTMVAQFPVNVYKIKMSLDYQANRKRTETISAVLTAAVQPTLSDSSEQDREAISFTSDFVGQRVDLDGSIPIGNVAYRSYFQTGRGNASFEYLLLAARAKLRARARAVDVTFAVPWRDALGITLRHNVRLADRRLPGGVAVGKVKSYRLTSHATMLGEFTLGCCIGTGETPTLQAGAPVYVDTGYVNSGYEIMAGAQVMAGGDSDLAYQTLDDFAVIDDGLDLTRITAREAVISCNVYNGLTTQIPELASFQGSKAPANGDPIQKVSELKTTVTLELAPLQGSEFHTAFYPALTPLRLPKTIDLGA